MTADLFERYRDALRRGHVAAARGELEAAMAAYDEAIALAPDRPVAHVGVGSVHLRLGDLRAALAAFDRALAATPRDEAALRGRADALSGLGRRADAAEALDRLAVILEAAGRLPEALDAARHALALAEGRARRRHVERLTERTTAPSTREAIEDARPDPMPSAEETDLGSAAPSGEAAGAGVVASDDARHALLEIEGATRVGAAVDPVERMHEAEDAYDRGDLDVARREALEAAAGFRVAGQIAAAIDACYLALTIAPDDPHLHLALVELYLERGWRSRAAEKLLLLGRLAELDGDRVTRDRLCAIARAEFPADQDLAAVCS